MPLVGANVVGAKDFSPLRGGGSAWLHINHHLALDQQIPLSGAGKRNRLAQVEPIVRSLQLTPSDRSIQLKDGKEGTSYNLN